MLHAPTIESMRTHKRMRNSRRGATAVEFAIVLPIVLLLLIGLCVIQLGTFRYNQIASLAQESARWASVHGKEFANQFDSAIATKEDIFNQVIQPRAKGLDLSKLEYDIVWDENRKMVTVTLRYAWIPETFFSQQVISCTAVSLCTY
ncbi:MAG: TadE/TadG family type IV pilus assembly protein [Pirellulaceae bacterium]